ATGSTAAEVRHAVSGQLGRPLASISRSEVHDALAKIDRIGSYSLALKPPNTMVLRVTQRVPVAAVRHAGGYATVDAAGVSLAQSRARPALPLVTSRVDTKGFAAAIQVIQALPATVDKRVDTVSATSLDNVAFTLRGHHGATVVWGDRSKPALKAKVLTALLGAVPHAARYDVSSPGDAVTR
ncbi:MAG TPA: cell division protein FtsQ/DivIB, partial [Microbacteriaceae bacterium]|nr:cell division protein FtsQ/DivIB [Microbacteriaceae bacterium]